MTELRQHGEQPSVMHRRLVDALYTDALLLADEARDVFDTRRSGHDLLDPAVRIDIACEALRVTTRLMHVVAWLLTRRAVNAGELTAAEALRPSHRLGAPPAYDAATVARLPGNARRLVMDSVALHRRAATHDAALVRPVQTSSPAHALRTMLAERV